MCRGLGGCRERRGGRRCRLLCRWGGAFFVFVFCEVFEGEGKKRGSGGGEDEGREGGEREKKEGEGKKRSVGYLLRGRERGMEAKQKKKNGGGFPCAARYYRDGGKESRFKLRIYLRRRRKRRRDPVERKEYVRHSFCQSQLERG